MKMAMEQKQVLRNNKNGKTSPENGFGLNMVLVYEDAQTRQWAREVYDRAASTAGSECVRATWWKMGDLCEPGVLAGAASTAMRADFIVIATRAAEGLPLPVYFWVKQWLPHRCQRVGALVALLGIPQGNGSKPGRVGEYLRGIAAVGRLDFQVQERKLVDDPSECLLERNFR
jgi:hypothetical protein